MFYSKFKSKRKNIKLTKIKNEESYFNYTIQAPKKTTISHRIILFLIILIFFLLFKLISKAKYIRKLEEENKILRLDKNSKSLELKQEESKTQETNSLYMEQLLLEYNNIKALNKNDDIISHIKSFINKLSKEFLKEEINDDNIKSDNKHNNNNDKYQSTLKNIYFTSFENTFNKYRNKTEESDEYKNMYKNYLLDGYSSLFNKQYKNIDTIVFSKVMNLGNALFTINNLLYYCEILNCKNVYLSQDYWFIKNKIHNPEFDITISPYNDENICNNDNNNSVVCLREDTSFDDAVKLFRGDYFIPIRNYIIKDEFLSNIKLKETSEDDLYINIRSGEDIFKNEGYSPGGYYQPPLCFYQAIIENFNFTNIYIISNGKENPVVEELLKLYNNIKYFHGTIEEDAAFIISAKNLVLPVSSFPVELIKFSDNLKNLFVFDLISEGDQKMWHFTDKHLRPCKFNRYIMYPNKEYTDIMIPWERTKIQFERMINEKCIKKFKIIPSDFI